jgi:uncharacterized protein
VLTTPSLEGLAIEDYSLRVAEAWKIGHKGLDNGVILTVAPSERAVRIEVGYGLEGVLPDAICARIIREQITPQFRAGQMEAGIVAGVDAIAAVTRGEVLPHSARPSDSFPTVGSLLQLAFWIVLFLVFFSRSPWLWWLFMPSPGGYRRGGFGGGFGGGGFGGGGFGGGGFSGGGGGFGGGGASGRW